VKRFKPFFAKNPPATSPRWMESRWIPVVIRKRLPIERDELPVHRPADILSTDNASPRRKASLPESTIGP